MKYLCCTINIGHNKPPMSIKLSVTQCNIRKQHNAYMWGDIITKKKIRHYQAIYSALSACETEEVELYCSCAGGNPHCSAHSHLHKPEVVQSALQTWLGHSHGLGAISTYHVIYFPCNMNAAYCRSFNLIMSNKNCRLLDTDNCWCDPSMKASNNSPVCAVRIAWIFA